MTLLNILAQVDQSIEAYRLFDIKLINVEDFTELIVRLLLNMAVIIVIVAGLYARNSKRRDFFFSFIAISIVIFLLCFLLESVKMELGFAFGLFAIFGIIRYRTDPIPIKEMTYLFVIIAISVINALANKKISHAELVFTNLVIIAGLWGLEKVLHLKQELSQLVIYEKIENLQADKKEVLLADLKDRTGIDVKHYEVKKIDFMRDICYINIFYDAHHDYKIRG
ncbi:DUF4956 domain-containing protein [Sunxiuqinia indica]|uniref:DUF4956 domain-containing protein n=1 Tax=Sunxiuqinia indica TaxID=2692584 RepID=UPI0013570D25|nr:DUF4956 domain-containing protein [Sunxiuqinia indica]